MSGSGLAGNVGLLGLAAAGAAVLAVAALTARPPQAALPDLDGYFTRWSALHGGYDPRGARLTRGWLTMAYYLSRPLARRGVLPDAVTLAGVWAGLAVCVPAAARGRWPLAGCAVLVASGLLDNLDGCVAALTDRATPFGYLLDSLVDRVTDALYLVAFWALGAPAGLCVGAGAALVALEYTRARAGNAGFGEIGVLTLGERPTRVIVSAVTLLCAGVFPHRQPLVAGVGAAAVGGLCAIGSLQLLVVVRRILTRPRPAAADAAA